MSAISGLSAVYAITLELFNCHAFRRIEGFLEFCDLVRAEDAPFSRLQMFGSETSDTDADEPLHVESDGFEHAANLPVDALLKDVFSMCARVNARR